MTCSVWVAGSGWSGHLISLLLQLEMMKQCFILLILFTKLYIIKKYRIMLHYQNFFYYIHMNFIQNTQIVCSKRYVEGDVHCPKYSITNPAPWPPQPFLTTLPGASMYNIVWYNLLAKHRSLKKWSPFTQLPTFWGHCDLKLLLFHQGSVQACFLGWQREPVTSSMHQCSCIEYSLFVYIALHETYVC